MTPLFKKSDPVDKVKYRPVSLLSRVSKVYDDHFQSNQYIPVQISAYFKPYFSSSLTNFRKSNISNKKFLSLKIWFYNYCMVLKTVIWVSVLILTKEIWFSKITLTSEGYLVLRITMDNRLTIYNYLKSPCKKIANKLNALIKIAPYLNHNQIRLVYNQFLRDGLGIALLLTFCFWRSNHLINKLQERVLKIAYYDLNSSFSDIFWNGKQKYNTH